MKLYDILPDWTWKIYCRFRTIRRAILRLISWFPVIWKDEDWDEVYLFEIMRFKISRMRKNMEKKTITTWKKYSDEMKQAEYLLRRMSGFDNYFYSENTEKYEDMIKNGICTCPEELVTLESLPNECSRMHFHYCKFCEKSNKYWMERDRVKKRYDIEYTMKFIAKKSSRWWD